MKVGARRAFGAIGVLARKALGRIGVLGVLGALAACGGDDSSSVDAASSGERTLASCSTTVASEVPEPYRSLFRCVDMSISGGDLVITTSGLPPHKSYYYGSASPNYEPWDDRGGTYHANPNTLRSDPATFSIPLAPSSRNLTITASLVDGVNGTSGSEYRGGPAGVALDSVFLFNALAAPGDDISVEQYTFDEWNAHPAPSGQYHYHRDTPGPAQVNANAYGLMCDGTFALGCTELDGTAADESGLDAQNGHVGDVGVITGRYHVHLCPAWAAHPRPYTPEIQYYDRCTVR